MISGKCYVVMAGSARVSRDPELIRRLWSPTYRAWFPDGKDDREATVIRVVVERIDYWEPSGSPIARLVQAVKALLTRRAVETPMKTLDGFEADCRSCSSTDQQVFQDDSRSAVVPLLAGDGGEPWRDGAGVPRRARVTALE